MNDIKSKFNIIKNKGWIKSIRKGSTGIGATFENLLGLDENSFEAPDYNGIEIKTKRALSNSYTSLFNYSPRGIKFCDLEEFKNKYGYPDKFLKNYKVLNKSFYYNEKVRVSNYYFILKLNKNCKKIILYIIDLNGNLIDNNIYWNFDEIEEKMNRKLSLLAFIKADRKFIGNSEYFKYNEMNLYKFNNFGIFVDLFEKGLIRITFKLGVFRDGPNIGKINNHGTSFDIKEKDLIKLFDKVDDFI